MLTKEQLRAAAAASRELAMECVNGTAPNFGAHSYWVDDANANAAPCCALGHLQYRSGIGRPGDMESPLYLLPLAATEAWEFLGKANDSTPGGERQAVLQWAFLYLADELENAAEPQKDLP